MTVREAARLLGVTANRLHKLVGSRRLPVSTVPTRNGKWRYDLDPADVEAFARVPRPTGRHRTDGTGLSTGDAARVLQVSNERVRQLSRDGKLTRQRHGKQRWRYDPAEIEALAKARNGRTTVAASRKTGLPFEGAAHA